MEQNRSLSSGGEAKGQGRFGRHVPNQYSPINLANNSIYNQLGLEAALSISLGVNMCFYVNKLDHKQLDDLIASFPNNAISPSDKKQDRLKPINWLSTISYSQFGRNPSDIFKDSVDLYNSFDIDKEEKKISSYGLTSLSMDFSKLPLLKAENGEPAFPFGILFFSDLNGYGSFNASISTLLERKRDAQKCPYITPISYDYRGQVNCTGKYRIRGNYIIFYVTNEIEKQEGDFYPDVTIINIPVSISRDQKDWNIIKSTYACNIKRRSNCVLTSFVEYIVKDIFGFYGFTDIQPIAEIVHAFGYDPTDYNYPPSISDEKSKYYGGNHIHAGLSKNDFTRRERPFNHNANLFSYLSEISKNSEIDITVSAPKKEKDEKDNHKPKQGKKPSKKEKELAAPKEDEPADIQPPTTYTDSEIDAAFGSAVAEPAPSLSGDEETSGCGFLVEEKVEVEESVDEVQNNEESPQGENTNVKEEVAINGIE